MSPENPSRMSHDTMAVIRGGLCVGTRYCSTTTSANTEAWVSIPQAVLLANHQWMLPCCGCTCRDRRRRAPRAVARDLGQRQLRPSIPPGNALDSVGNLPRRPPGRGRTGWAAHTLNYSCDFAGFWPVRVKAFKLAAFSIGS
jgi:hypothetical protein